MKKTMTVIALFLLATSVNAKDDWQMQMHKWMEKSQSNPNCKVWYATGIYRAGMGTSWGMMNEKMFKWFSTKGEKIAPGACPTTEANIDKAKYRILFTETPVRTQTQTVYGAEAQTQTQPTQATFNASTTYQNGNSTTTNGTINGTETNTVVVPTETTYTQSRSTLYMYTYRVNGSPWQIIAADDVDYNRVDAVGSGQYAAEAELGARIGNLIRASKDKHRADRLYRVAMESIIADGGDKLQ